MLKCCPDDEVGVNSHFYQEIVKHMFISEDSRVHTCPGNCCVVLEDYLNPQIKDGEVCRISKYVAFSSW